MSFQPLTPRQNHLAAGALFAKSLLSITAGQSVSLNYATLALPNMPMVQQRSAIYEAQAVIVKSFEIEDGLSSKDITDELTSIVALAEKPFVLVGKANREIFFSASKNALAGVTAYTLCLFLFIVILSYFTFFRFVKNLIAEHIESEQSYRNQFAGNSAAMLLIDPKDGAIIDANAAALSFYGYTHDEP